MKRMVLNSVLIMILTLTFCLTTASAQQSIKGDWTFTTNTPEGNLDVHITFSNNGKGYVLGPGPTGRLPIIYRLINNNLNLSYEGPGFMEDGSDITLVFRGVVVDENTITGISTIITEMPDRSNATGYSTFQLQFTGSRDK